MALFWRILHMLTARYGNYPMGQLPVALTMVFLNERGTPPTMTEICSLAGELFLFHYGTIRILITRREVAGKGYKQAWLQRRGPRTIGCHR